MIIKLILIDEEGYPINKEISNISLYGSFYSDKPDIRENDFTERNPCKMLIKEPYSEKSKVFTENRTLYICMQSINDDTIYLQMNTFVKVKAEYQQEEPGVPTPTGSRLGQGHPDAATAPPVDTYTNEEGSECINSDYR